MRTARAVRVQRSHEGILTHRVASLSRRTAVSSADTPIFVPPHDLSSAFPCRLPADCRSVLCVVNSDAVRVAAAAAAATPERICVESLSAHSLVLQSCFRWREHGKRSMNKARARGREGEGEGERVMRRRSLLQRGDGLSPLTKPPPCGACKCSRSLRLLLSWEKSHLGAGVCRSRRHSYRTGQDIENCGTCRDCACIIYRYVDRCMKHKGLITGLNPESRTHKVSMWTRTLYSRRLGVLDRAAPTLGCMLGSSQCRTPGLLSPTKQQQTQ
ncbi:Protein FAM196A [Liparis tanakae]|uniref:Protein FAM196A n=1 Tax=Liparis tanakae TaxID=230148 RepID=A0A4Z2IHE0_9TELE|nr:Protein FAM196A [Liparis tanakae]